MSKNRLAEVISHHAVINARIQQVYQNVADDLRGLLDGRIALAIIKGNRKFVSYSP